MLGYYFIAGGIVVLLLIAVCIAIGFRRRAHRADPEQFQSKWKELQKLCADKTTWSQAVVEADKLLDDALKVRKFRGKTVGERLTRAQRTLSDNEGAWFGHKLKGKIDTDPESKLKEKEVKQALVGIRQALKDLGAFRHDK